MPSPPQAGNEFAVVLFGSSSEQYFSRCVTSMLMSLREMPTPQHTSTVRIQLHQDLHDSSVAAMPREMQREVNTGLPVERRLHIDYSTNNRPPQLHAATEIDCCFTAILFYGESQPDPES